jgi:predicted O-methyltransferase YrrM
MPQNTTATLVSQNPVLKEIFATGLVADAQGQKRRVHSQLCAAFAEALYRVILERRPSAVLEVGMAFGVSTLAILTALRLLGRGGRLISIDPNQSTNWAGMGTRNVAQADLQQFHQLIEEPDFIALPKLLTGGCKLDFAYIDGWHTFDYTLLDFYYIDKMLNVNGVVAFNDCGYPAVHKVINFVLTHRHYREIEAGLKPLYPRMREVVRLLRGQWSRRQRVLHQDRYFEKTEHWEPNYDFFAEF